ncbi:MAG: NAD(P)H:quinone oxidoreductase [Granulosicoccus sp.]|nr:NAD(P)H:quinone oxidoreductase [Granulosicoccus sp.]
MSDNDRARILIVYDSNSGNTYRMAQQIGRGVESVRQCTALLRAAPKVGERNSSRLPPVPDSGAPYAEVAELLECEGLIIGSPTHFGNMSASLKHFLDRTTPYWLGGKLSGKPAAAFTSTGSMHGGQEATLLGMMVPLLHHGMLICGLPYTHPQLMQTRRGGTPYGASHVSGEDGKAPLVDSETVLCRALGARVASTACLLAGRASDTLSSSS